MADGLTPSEKYVSSLCRNSFLKLWTHPNPKGKKGKELCDCLIVCGCHVIIISVKECNYKDTGDRTGWERWQKAAIEKSASQIWGAERWIINEDKVVRSDGRAVSLPPKEERKYHRISVSLGSKGQVPLKWGDLGNGFIHVCDEYSMGVLFGALDTITDFVNFLTASEDVLQRGAQLVFAGGGVEDLVALYLSHDQSFNFSGDPRHQPDVLVLTENLWREFSKSNVYKARLKEVEDSYMWDALIDYFINDLLTDGMFDMLSKEITKDESALVEMALQPREYRAVLAKAFIELPQASEGKVVSRVVKAYGSTAFVFLLGRSADRGLRFKELGLRCLVARGRLQNVKIVVGIATDRPGTSEIGYSSDIAYIHLPELTKEHEAHINYLQKELGYFKNLD